MEKIKKVDDTFVSAESSAYRRVKKLAKKRGILVNANDPEELYATLCFSSAAKIPAKYLYFDGSVNANKLNAGKNSMPFEAVVAGETVKIF